MTSDEVSPLRQSAIQAHEMYVELRAVGFTRGEAIELLAKMLMSAVDQTGQGSDDD